MEESTGVPCFMKLSETFNPNQAELFEGSLFWGGEWGQSDPKEELI